MLADFPEAMYGISCGRCENMRIECVWEHNGDDSLLYAISFPGAYTRGENQAVAMAKMPAEICSYLQWLHRPVPEEIYIDIVQNVPSVLQISDADSDVLFRDEEYPLTLSEYHELKGLALKSASDFLTLYQTIPNQEICDRPLRRTFYGQVPATATQMYLHTKNVNSYYFGEIGVDADNEGTILDCRIRGFTQLEAMGSFLENPIIEGSYGERWTLRKVLRRFIWHDRIHARAMYRLAKRICGKDQIPNIFCFDE